MPRRNYLGELELVLLLALIRLGDEAYGVPIARELEHQARRSVSLGSVYATLERLEERGLVKSRIGEPTAERGGRAKRYFAITAQGMREVRETQRTLVRLWKTIPQLKGGFA